MMIERIMTRELFLGMLDLEVKRARRYQNFFSILKLKLSPLAGFENGYEFKTCCRALSEFLAETLRGSDVLTSLGDDEWAILIPYADFPEIGPLRLRLMGILEYYNFKKKGYEVITDLICFPRDGTTGAELFGKI
jgi:GGDEF domain-containing protein